MIFTHIAALLSYLALICGALLCANGFFGSSDPLEHFVTNPAISALSTAVDGRSIGVGSLVSGIVLIVVGAFIGTLAQISYNTR